MRLGYTRSPWRDQTDRPGDGNGPGGGHRGGTFGPLAMHPAKPVDRPIARQASVRGRHSRSLTSITAQVSFVELALLKSPFQPTCTGFFRPLLTVLRRVP